MAGEQDDAARLAAEAFEAALTRATQNVERELARVVRAGEDELDRLARRIAETLARLALDGVLGEGERAQSKGEAGFSSLNQIAGALAKAARRGARFT